MTKTEALKKLEEEMRSDSHLPLIEANLVFGEGDPEAEVMFTGEAPGFYEDREGRPFVGQAGKLLDKLFAEIKWPRGSVYVTNIVKRRPPQNRDPLPEEIAAYAPYLKKQIEVINPKIIVPLGRFSMNYFLPEAKISRDQGRVFRLRGKLIFPLYHPAAALRSTTVLGALRNSFLKLPEIIARSKELIAKNNEAGSLGEKSEAPLSLFD
ncbi:MAG TPA: uracil-DNA glycosylase [Candidatus Tyrphobacter sp.]|nr:uracil-DNA glycosylase [Candidatus Tyrphobacter sp.]